DIQESDFERGTEMSKERVVQIAASVQQCVLRYFPDVCSGANNDDDRTAPGRDKRGLCVILAAPTVIKQKNVPAQPTPTDTAVLPPTAGPTSVRKTGLHIVFPYLRVDLNQALDLRAGIVAALDRSVQ